MQRKKLIKCAHYPLISLHKKYTMGKIYYHDLFHSIFPFFGHNFLFLCSYLLCGAYFIAPRPDGVLSYGEKILLLQENCG